MLMYFFVLSAWTEIVDSDFGLLFLVALARWVPWLCSAPASRRPGQKELVRCTLVNGRLERWVQLSIGHGSDKVFYSA